jgi:hypothetical protein
VVHFSDGQPVYLDPHLYEPDEPIDLRCPGCRQVRSIVRFELHPAMAGIVAIAAHHGTGCQAVRDLAAMAGRPS